MSRAFIIAGEASGDALGAALMTGLKTLAPGRFTFDGVGGEQMASAGLQSLFPMDELSVMGIAEVLPRYRQLSRRIGECAGAINAAAPDLFLSIDSPDFNLRIARRVRAAGTKTRIVHYVAPTVWAWRPGRAAKMAGLVDQVLALFPFEPPYLQEHGIRCDFVGHPVATAPVATPDQVAAFRARYDLGADSKVLLVLPGSRAGEVARLAPVFGAAVVRVLARHPGMRVVVPAAPAVYDQVRALTTGWPGTPVVLNPADGVGEKRAAFGAAQVALAASGTVSLELAAAATPMVVAYDMNWLSYRIISQMAKIDTVTLVNIVTNSRVVPEYLGPACRPGPIAEALLALLDDPAARQAQLDAAADTMARLGRGGQAPGLRAAQAVLDGLDENGGAGLT